MMSQRKAGKRHRLLLYQRLMDRLWGATLFLGLLLAAVWWWSGKLIPSLTPPYDTVLAIIAAIVLLFSFLALLGRGMSYAQARRDHLRVVTPFLRLKISYRRVRTVHPADFKQIFPPQKASWAQRRFLEPYYGQTALVVELSSFPLSPRLLRLFLPPQMFDPQITGLVFLVKDWMGLSNDIDSFRAAWKQAQTRQAAPGAYQSPHGLLGNLKKK